MSGKFSFGVFGEMTFQEGSTLTYNSTTDKLTIDSQVRSSSSGTKFNLDLTFGEINFANGAKDVEAGGEVTVQFANAGSKATFDILNKNDVGDLETIAGYKGYPAGYDFTVMASMMPLIRASGNNLYFDAWLKVWGRGPGKVFDAAGDLHNVTLTKVNRPHTPPGNPIPEPMSMGLLATGLLGSAITRRKLKKA